MHVLFHMALLGRGWNGREEAARFLPRSVGGLISPGLPLPGSLLMPVSTPSRYHAPLDKGHCQVKPDTLWAGLVACLCCLSLVSLHALAMVAGRGEVDRWGGRELD